MRKTSETQSLLANAGNSEPDPRYGKMSSYWVLMIIDLACLVALWVLFSIHANDTYPPYKSGLFRTDSLENLQKGFEMVSNENLWRKATKDDLDNYMYILETGLNFQQARASVLPGVPTTVQDIYTFEMIRNLSSMSNLTDEEYMATVAHIIQENQYFFMAPPVETWSPFVECVEIHAAIMMNRLNSSSYDKTETHSTFKEAYWRCSERNPTPTYVYKTATNNMVVIFFYWTLMAFAIRTAALAMVHQDMIMSTGLVIFFMGATIAGLVHIPVVSKIFQDDHDFVDISVGQWIITCISLIFIGLCMVFYIASLFEKRKNADAKDVKKIERREWFFFGFLKAIVVVPAYAIIVQGLTGIFEIWSIIVIFNLAVVLGMISASLSYSRYVDHVYKSKTAYARDPHLGFYTITLLCLFTVCFVPWVRRADEQILWNSLLSTLFFITGICVSVPCTYLMQYCNADSKMFGWQTMALPELVCDYENSNKIKTMSELFIRIVLTLGFIYGMIN